MGSRYPPSDSASSRRHQTKPAMRSVRRSTAVTATSTPPPPTETNVKLARRCRVPNAERSEVFFETKVWISDFGYAVSTLHAFEKSARKLGVEQIDLLILHQALPTAFDRTLVAHRGLVDVARGGQGSRRSGSGNFMDDEHLVYPLGQRHRGAGRQRDRMSPSYFSQSAVEPLLARNMASSPRRGHRSAGSPSTATPITPAPSKIQAIGAIATAHDKSPAQVMLRWGLQHGRSVIPKSTKPARIAENFDVFDFKLSVDEMSEIDGLDTGRRGGPEPDAITLEAFGSGEIPEN